MDKETKQAHADLADYAEKRANDLLDNAVDFGSKHGAQACIGQLIEAGALLSSAAALRERAK